MNSTPTPHDDHASEYDFDTELARHTTSDGTVYWGDVPAERFTAATERFPVMSYVLAKYFGSPEHSSHDQDFIDRYEKVGESGGEFTGFKDELADAIKHYGLAAALVNGLLGTQMSSEDIRGHLVSLRDQILHEGDFAPKQPQQDRYLIESAPDRMRASFLRPREVPFGPWKGRPIPLAYWFAAGAVLVLAGIGITYIPVIGKIGLIPLVAGILLVLFVAVGTLGIREDVLHPDQAEERNQVRAAAEGRKSKGFWSRINPFTN